MFHPIVIGSDRLGCEWSIGFDVWVVQVDTGTAFVGAVVEVDVGPDFGQRFVGCSKEE